MNNCREVEIDLKIQQGEGSEQSPLLGLPEAGALRSYLFGEEEGEEEECGSFDSSG